MKKPVKCWLQLRNNTVDSLVQTFVFTAFYLQRDYFCRFFNGRRGNYSFSKFENIKWQPLMLLLMSFYLPVLLFGSSQIQAVLTEQFLLLLSQ